MKKFILFLTALFTTIFNLENCAKILEKMDIDV